MTQLLLIGAGGFCGSIARWAGALFPAFPAGTLAVNLSGSLLLGLILGLAERSVLPAELRVPVGVGFIGAYTTFSTYMLESWRLLEVGEYGTAAVNLGGSIGLGLVAVGLGLLIGRTS